MACTRCESFRSDPANPDARRGGQRLPYRHHASQEQTWQRVHVLLPRFTITRLEEVRLPVHVVYWPVSSTLAMSVGTGLTPTGRVAARDLKIIERDCIGLNPPPLLALPVRRRLD